MGFKAEEIAMEIIEEVREVLPLVKRDRQLADQIRRATSGIALTVGEGAVRRGGNKRLLFEAALGSAREVRKALAVAVAWRYVTRERVAKLDALLDQECAILWRLVHPKPEAGGVAGA